MKKLFVLIIGVFSIFFLACEEDVIPIPLPPSQPAADAPAEDKTELQAPAAEKPSEPAKTAKASTAKAPPAKESVVKTTVYYAQDGDVGQSSTGRYIIQVAISPFEASAKKMIKKLSESGIKAYSAKVQDPAPEKGMVGTYYRVRVGFFDAKTAAEAFAKARLEPIGYKWWVDRSKNDNVGSRVITDSEPFVVERIQEPAPKQMTEKERKEAERAAAIAAAKEEYKAIAKAATAAPPVVPPPKIPPKAPKVKAKPKQQQ